MKKNLFIILMILSVSAKAQTLVLTGDNHLILDGERFSNKKIQFTKAEGDWFTKTNDGHGTITFYASYDNRQLLVNLEWDGKEPIPITDETRHKQRTGDFMLTLPDKDIYGDGLTSIPEGDDEVRVKILKIDALTVSAEITGSVTEDSKEVKLNGVFNLKKADPKTLTSAKYRDCDNVLYDKLTFAEDRSTTDCEAKFDKDVKSIFYQAIEKSLAELDNNHWIIKSKTDPEPAIEVHRGTENYFSHLGEIYAELQLDPSSEEGQAWQKKLQSAFDEVRDNASNAAYKPDNKKLEKILYDTKANSSIYLSVGINSESGGLYAYKGEIKILKVPGTVYAVQASYVGARTGGGIDNAVDATVLFIGKWKPGTIEKNSEGGATVRTVGLLNKSASHLSVQNISVYIEAAPSIANLIISNLDISKLSSLIQ